MHDGWQGYDDEVALARANRLDWVCTLAALVAGSFVLVGGVAAPVALVELSPRSHAALHTALELALTALHIPLTFAIVGLVYGGLRQALLDDRQALERIFTPQRRITLVLMVLALGGGELLAPVLGEEPAMLLGLAGVGFAVAQPRSVSAAAVLGGMTLIWLALYAGSDAMVQRALLGTPGYTPPSLATLTGVVVAVGVLGASFGALPAVVLTRRELSLYRPWVEGDYQTASQRAAATESWLGEYYGALVALDTGDLDRASRLTKQLNERQFDPRTTTIARTLRAEVLLALGGEGAARAWFQSAADCHPWWAAHDGLARCALREGQLQEALDQSLQASTAVRRSPVTDWLRLDARAVPLATRAWALAVAGRHDDARCLIDDLRTRCRPQHPTHRAAVLFRLASAAFHYDRDEALLLAREGTTGSGRFARHCEELARRLGAA